MSRRQKKITKQVNKDIKKLKPKKYVLNLYVAGLSPGSQRAISNIKNICEEHLPGRVKLSVQDIYKNPIISRNEQILAAPTLIKKLPLPLRRFVGDMSDTKKMLIGLDLKSKE